MPKGPHPQEESHATPMSFFGRSCGFLGLSRTMYGSRPPFWRALGLGKSRSWDVAQRPRIAETVNNASVFSVFEISLLMLQLLLFALSLIQVCDWLALSARLIS